MARFRVRLATRRDLDLLVRHRRGMWESMGERDRRALDEGDRVYRRWARQRLSSKRLVGLIVEDATGHRVASGCIWLRPTQPGLGNTLLQNPYLLSMYTEPTIVAGASVRGLCGRPFGGAGNTGTRD